MLYAGFFRRIAIFVEASLIIYYHYELALEPLSDIFRSLAAFTDALIELYCQLLSVGRVVAAPND